MSGIYANNLFHFAVKSRAKPKNITYYKFIHLTSCNKTSAIFFVVVLYFSPRFLWQFCLCLMNFRLTVWVCKCEIISSLVHLNMAFLEISIEKCFDIVFFGRFQWKHPFALFSTWFSINKSLERMRTFIIFPLYRIGLRNFKCRKYAKFSFSTPHCRSIVLFTLFIRWVWTQFLRFTCSIHHFIVP